MDAIRISKVPNISLSRSGKTLRGTLHLTAHHLIFSYDDGDQPEMWVPYPLINLVTRLPQTLRGQCPISFRCRTFESFSLHFDGDGEALDVFESVKELTVATSVSQLYAFFYVPNPPLTVHNGWTLYSPREEFGRMGVGTRSKAWRFTDINKDYSFCPTYPSRLVVPTRISDATLQYALKYRSKGRIPALTYLHWANYGSITRSSQPMVGLTNARSIQDEKLIEAVFQSHTTPESRAAASTPVYGATTTNLIIDARPTTNAVANTAKGAGTENMDHYKDCRKAYLGIDNIHTMRDSLGKVVEALRETEALAASVGALPIDRQALRRSGWLRHIGAILEGTIIIIRNVHINSSHVLIHCSDGWDRTSQLSSVAQLCLDPFYRTIRGFEILIEKDWVSFGHKFMDRCGHLSSDKFFIAPVDPTGSGGGAEAAQAFFASVQNRFASNNHIKETSPVFHQFLETVRNIQRQFPERFEFNELFLRELHYHLYSCQFGTFLFDSELERRECTPSVFERTTSVWDYLNSEPRAATFVNPGYQPELDDPANRAPKMDQGVLMPNPKNVRFWNELYGRGDEEMNGRFVAAQVQGVEVTGPVENSEDDPVISTPQPTPPVGPVESTASPSPSPSPAPPAQEAPATPLVSPPILPSRTNSLMELATPPRRESPLPRTPSPSTRLPPSPSRSRTTQAATSDLFNTSGFAMKSVWGRLSSNATAAFSAVQGAYDGVAKDLRGMNLAGPSSDATEKGGELRHRDELPAWGDPGAVGSTFETGRVTQAVRPSTFSAGATANPWATSSRERPLAPSIFDDNPWGMPASRIDPAMSASSTGLWGGLPGDPTVAQPSPVRPPPSRGASGGLGPQAPLASAVAPAIDGTQVDPPSEPPSSDAKRDGLDPLGVGLM
ncbi:protein-tyrosine phosphatase-like protein [Amylostereum chailletii]|nr:protein-tyrosine phosphatase-like protein [Amylostereum chailletii]